MKLSVWRVGTKWRPSQWEDGLNLVVIFKGIDDDNLGKTYKLNINSQQPNKGDWLRACVEGNVLDVNVLPGTTTVSKRGPFRLIKKTEKGAEARDEDGQLPGQLSLV